MRFWEYKWRQRSLFRRMPSFQSISPLITEMLFSLKVVSNSTTPWSAAQQASPSFTITWSFLKLMSIELVMPSHHLILCRSLLLLGRGCIEAILRHTWTLIPCLSSQPISQSLGRRRIIQPPFVDTPSSPLGASPLLKTSWKSDRWQISTDVAH